jgi:S-adenosyl methyltransferase
MAPNGRYFGSMDAIEVAELALSLPDVDPAQPSPARIYDFWLGGSQNF